MSRSSFEDFEFYSMALDCILLQCSKLHFSYILTSIEIENKAAFLLHFDCIYMQFCGNKTLFIMQFSCILAAFQAQNSAQIHPH